MLYIPVSRLQETTNSYTYGLRNLQAHFHFNSRVPPHTIWPKIGLVEVHIAALIQIQVWTAARPCRLLANVSESRMSGHATLPAPLKPNYSPLHTSYHTRLESWPKTLPWITEPAPLLSPALPWWFNLPLFYPVRMMQAHPTTAAPHYQHVINKSCTMCYADRVIPKKGAPLFSAWMLPWITGMSMDNL